MPGSINVCHAYSSGFPSHSFTHFERLCRCVASAHARASAADNARLVRPARRVLVDDNDGALHFVDKADVVVEADSLRDSVAPVDAAAATDDAAQEAAVLAHLEIITLSWSPNLRSLTNVPTCFSRCGLRLDDLRPFCGSSPLITALTGDIDLCVGCGCKI